MLNAGTIEAIAASSCGVACAHKVQVIHKVLPQKFGEHECWLCDISDGAHFVGAFFRKVVDQPKEKVTLNALYVVRAYHFTTTSGAFSAKLIVDDYALEGGCEDMLGAPTLFEMPPTTAVAATPLAATAVAQEDACVPYASVVVGQKSTPAAICGRLLGAVSEKRFKKRDGSGDGSLASCMLFHRGAAVRVTSFDGEMQTAMRALRLGDCVLLSRFAAEKPGNFDQGATVAVIVNRSSSFEPFAPMRSEAFDTLSTIARDVLPEREDTLYVTLVLRVSACGALEKTRNDKDILRLTLADSTGSVNVTLFGDQARLPFTHGALLLVANAAAKYDSYAKSRTIDISPFFSSIVFGLESIAACGPTFEAAANALLAAAADDGLPPGDEHAYGRHAPLEDLSERIGEAVE